MSASHSHLLRQLRVAFSAAELELLQSDKAFAKALQEAKDTPGEVQNLIELAGALIASRNRSKSKLRHSRDQR